MSHTCKRNQTAALSQPLRSSSVLFVFSAKPIGLVERCYCSTVNNVPRGLIRELKFVHTPNCPFQVMWVFFSVTGCSECHPHKHVSHPGLKTSDRFPLYTTFLTINLREATAQRKELCMHVYTHAPPSLSQTHIEGKSFLALLHPQEVLWVWVNMKGRW